MAHTSLSGAVAALTLLTSLSVAQAPAPGLRLYGRLGETSTFLVDTSGAHVHNWNSDFRPGAATYLQDDGVLIRTLSTEPTPLGVGGDGGGIERRAFDNTLLWDWRYNGPGVLAHHDLEVLPNGNVLVIAWEEKTHQEMIDAGRDPALLAPGPFRPDHIVEVRQTGPTTGEIVWEWHVMDHLIQDFDPTKANYGVVADHPERIDVNYPPVAPTAGDFNHTNSIDYDPTHDWIILSVRAQNEIWIIDHSTTTAKARGSEGGNSNKGGDLLYRWGNPAAYGRGTIADQKLFGQHSARIIPAGYRGDGNVLLFNNDAHPGASAVWELELPLDPAGRFVRDGAVYGPGRPIWSYEGPSFYSPFVSSCERLPNGNTLICSGMQGWIFEVTPAGQIVWQIITGGTPVFHAHYVARSLWISDESLSIGTGDVAFFEFVAGSSRRGRPYLMLGSVSGTSPGFFADSAHVPLNVDSWLIQTLSSPNVLPLLNSTGQLDFRGRALASFLVPQGAFPAALIGLGFDHAMVTISAGGRVDLASNPVHFVLAP